LLGESPNGGSRSTGAFVDQVPRTSVGKYDKKQLRAAQAAGEVRILDSVPIS
jgi:acyl-CoA synthetase (AMP-forming)/AMP-acid ligase II